MVLDSAGLWFRAFYGVPDSITAPDGTPVNAVRGFLDMVSTLVERRRPARLVACLDLDWRPAWRVELLPSYKTHRLDLGGPPGAEDTPDPLATQVPVILDILGALGVATAGAPDYEADDIIGTLATRETGPVEVVTGDRDLFQLVDDAASVVVLYTGKGVANLAIVDEAELRRRYDIAASAYADFAVLRGDPSDGLPGVAGIGEKTAATLLNRFGGLDELLAASDAGDKGVASGQRAKLAAARDYLAVAPKVVRVATTIALPTLADAVPAKPVDQERLDELSERWGIARAVTRLRDVLAETATGAA